MKNRINNSVRLIVIVLVVCVFSAAAFGREVVRIKRGTNRYCVHGDGLGNPSLLTDNAGVIKEVYYYDYYGVTQVLDGQGEPVEGAPVNPFLYKGRYLDEENGLYWGNGRYYEPETSRSTSRGDSGIIIALEGDPDFDLRLDPGFHPRRSLGKVLWLDKLSPMRVSMNPDINPAVGIGHGGPGVAGFAVNEGGLGFQSSVGTGPVSITRGGAVMVTRGGPGLTIVWDDSGGVFMPTQAGAGLYDPAGGAFHFGLTRQASHFVTTPTSADVAGDVFGLRSDFVIGGNAPGEAFEGEFVRLAGSAIGSAHPTGYNALTLPTLVRGLLAGTQTETEGLRSVLTFTNATQTASRSFLT